MAPDTVVPFSARLYLGNFWIFASFMAVKYFQLTLAAMVINTGPLLTFFLVMLFFKEKMTSIQFMSLFIGFTSVGLMIFGDQ